MDHKIIQFNKSKQYAIIRLRPTKAMIVMEAGGEGYFQMDEEGIVDEMLDANPHKALTGLPPALKRAIWALAFAAYEQATQ